MMAGVAAKQICRTDMILLFPKLDQEKMQYPAFVDPQLVVFLREQYDVLSKAFQRLNTTVDVCARCCLACALLRHQVLTANGCWCVRQILKLSSVLDVTKDKYEQWNEILVCAAITQLVARTTTWPTSVLLFVDRKD